MSAAASLSSPLSSLQSLRVESLRALLPAPLPQAPGLSTGLAALDRALASGGLPRGRLSEIVGATGKLTLLRPIVEAAAQRDECVVYIDASRTLAPRDWAGIANLTVIRPPEAAQAAWCADVLLRSAAFSLVVLDSAPTISRAIAVRLTNLARESNAALVIVAGAAGESATRLGGAVRLHTYRRRQRLRISIEKGGLVSGESREGRLQKVVEVRCADGRVARRLCTHSEVPDRRGAARASSSRLGKAGRRAATPSLDPGGMLQYC